MEILELKEEIAEKEKDFIAKEKELNWLYETSMAEASGNIKVWHVRARRWAVILMFYWKSQCQTCFLRRRKRSWANRGRNFLTYRSSYFEPERAVNLTKSEEFFWRKWNFVVKMTMMTWWKFCVVVTSRPAGTFALMKLLFPILRWWGLPFDQYCQHWICPLMSSW